MASRKGGVGAKGQDPGSSSGLRRVVAIGRATASVLGAAGIGVDSMPLRALSSEIAGSLGDVAGRRVLIPSSDIARGGMAQELRALGALVDEVVAYRTLAASEALPDFVSP